MTRWRRRLPAPYSPSRITLCVPTGASTPGELGARPATTGEVTAYVCRGLACTAPITDLETLGRELAAP